MLQQAHPLHLFFFSSLSFASTHLASDLDKIISQGALVKTEPLSALLCIDFALSSMTVTHDLHLHNGRSTSPCDSVELLGCHRKYANGKLLQL